MSAEDCFFKVLPEEIKMEVPIIIPRLTKVNSIKSAVYLVQSNKYGTNCSYISKNSKKPISKLF